MVTRKETLLANSRFSYRLHMTIRGFGARTYKAEFVYASVDAQMLKYTILCRGQGLNEWKRIQ